MMTLRQMAEYVADRVGVRDDPTVDLAKRFLDRRYAMVYDSRLWSETLIAAQVTNATDSSIIHAPMAMERVLQVRYGDSGSSYRLEPVEHQRVFQVAPDALDEAGERVAWVELEPSAAWEPVAATDFFGVVSSSSLDTSQQVVIRGRDTSNGETLIFTVQLAGVTRVVQDVAGQYITGMDHLEMVSKPLTQGVVSVVHDTYPEVLTSTDKCTALDTWETSRLHSRIQLLRGKEEGDTSSESLLLFGKRRRVPLLSDSDTPSLSRVADILIALATADMLEQQRQYGKAQLKAQEGNALLLARVQEDRMQRGFVSQIVPQTNNYAEEGLLY